MFVSSVLWGPRMSSPPTGPTPVLMKTSLASLYLGPSLAPKTKAGVGGHRGQVGGCLGADLGVL